MNLALHESNYWEVNPQMKLSFKDVFNKDKSKGKSESSKLMWFLAFLIEEDNNEYAEMEESERYSFLVKELDIKLPTDIQELIDRYKSIRLKYVVRKLNNWKKKLDERDLFIESTEYNEESYEMLDKLMTNTDKIYKQYFAILNEVNKERVTHDLGGREVSLSDKGDI